MSLSCVSFTLNMYVVVVEVFVKELLILQEEKNLQQFDFT